MGKTKVAKYLLLLLVLLNMRSFSQELFTKELMWVSRDSIETIVFQDKNQIVVWGKNQLPFSTAYTKDVFAMGGNIYVVMISGCSGLPCWNIYIFVEKEGFWHLITKTNARLKEQIIINVDCNQENIIPLRNRWHHSNRNSQITSELEISINTLDIVKRIFIPIGVKDTAEVIVC